ncbi:flagellin N-terminal helical domain-containing protein [Cohnella fermenti]|uniref:Flagellin n=1 Tax=Cohnella fermenti TaxID=2565925 RepID=A0A4S4C525_9BACL|nr:flagellin [Cohnella fermenti]THF80801.1 flagellin FliC [Cohnella fermenti]
MASYINTNVSAMNTHRNLSYNTNQLSKTAEKLSSGYRINRAADDAAGLAISEKLRYQINGYNQASANAQDGISLIQTAEGALTEVHSMLQRLNTLATQASNGTLKDEDRDQIQLEVDQLKSEISNIVAKTKFNGISLLSGSVASVTFQVGWENGTTINASLGSGLNLTALGLNDLSLSSSQGAQAALTSLQTAITTVSSQRATFGAVQNRLEHTINNVGVSAENLSASESRIRDADIAKEMTEFTKYQILTQAGTSMLAQANSLPQNVLSLLG